MIKTLQKLQIYWPLILVTLFFSLFYLVFINLFNSDIGRHIANGREIIASVTGNQQNNLNFGADPGYSANFQKILKTNYYSYTQTEFPNINHHWFFGIISFVIHELGGFKLLTWFNLGLNTLAFTFILLTSLKVLVKEDKFESANKYSILVVTIVSFLIIPLISHRAEVRPETFSLLFLSIYYYLFTKINLSLNNNLKILNKWMWTLILALQIFWVNTHLFFIFGPLLAGYFLFQESLTLFIRQLDFRDVFSNTKVKFWLLLTSSLFLVSLINPHGINGLLAPFNIFNNYAYRVAENQSTFFLIEYGLQTKLNTYIIIVSIFAVIFGVISLFNKRIPLAKRISQLILLGIFAILANKISRMAPFLGVFMIPYVSEFILILWNDYIKKYKDLFNYPFFLMTVSTLIFGCLFLILSTGIFTPNLTKLGSGEIPNSNKPADFILKNNLKGPIFNNYDIGGYLAYSVFPREKLFIDNRPEAYSEDFLENEFLASLKNETAWERVEEKYNPNIIFFFRHDQVDGAQKFLFNRVRDENWIPVFVDKFTLIFVKNIDKNKTVIEKFEISKDVFGMNPIN